MSKKNQTHTQKNKLTIENPFLIIFTARKVNGKLTRPNLIWVLNRLIKKYPIIFGSILDWKKKKNKCVTLLKLK